MAKGSDARGALRGIRVLDFGQYIPGPLLGMLLSDQGAQVIKVEPPEGDPARREPAFATWNRGKRSVVLNLKTEEGRIHAQQLARNADVLIENFRPGVADRLGIGYKDLSSLNPRLVYCSMPGSPSGRSTLTTCAPWSDRSIPNRGPGMYCPKSRTRIPRKAPLASLPLPSNAIASTPQ